MKQEKLHCYICKEDKPRSEFYKDNGRRQGRNSSCKKCNTTYARRKNTLKRYRDSHSNEIKARDAVRVALAIGAIKRQSCAVCGEKKVHAHHYSGYAKKNWLTISWLCIKHHKESHND